MVTAFPGSCYGEPMFRWPLRKKSRPGELDLDLDLDKLEAVLFDLDGTLVDVDMRRFVAGYLARLTQRLADLGDPKRIAAVMRATVFEMLSAADGAQTMEELLCARLEAEFGIRPEQYRDRLERFCAADLADLRPCVQPHALSRTLVETCLQRGWQPVLATNPIFPRPVVDARLRWGGLADLPFAMVTSYETARYCKPHAGFFRHVLQTLEVSAEACLMVGNDTEHDLAAGELGVKTCLLTPWQISRSGRGFVPDWQGDHAGLLGLLNGRSSELCPAPPD